MNVVYHEKAKGGEWRTFLEGPMAEMQELLRAASAPVEAEWDQVADERGQSAYTLTLRDFAGEVKARFEPEELARKHDVRFRVFRLLGELLQVRNHKLLRELRAGDRENGNGKGHVYVVYPEKVELAEGNVLKQATAWLEGSLRNSTDPVEVEWDKVEEVPDGGGYVLKLRDFAGEVQTRFAPADLADANQMRIRVYRLLDELLRISTHKLLEQLREAGREDDNGTGPD